MKTETELILWGRQIKDQKGLTWDQIQKDIMDAYGKNYSVQNLSQCMNPQNKKVSGAKVAIKIIELYTDCTFEKEGDKPKAYFSWAIDKEAAA